MYVFVESPMSILRNQQEHNLYFTSDCLLQLCVKTCPRKLDLILFLFIYRMKRTSG